VRVAYVFEDAVAHDAGVQAAKDEQAAWMNAGLVDQRGVGDPADLSEDPGAADDHVAAELDRQAEPEPDPPAEGVGGPVAG
jgi:hypothetical protein